MVVMFVMSTSVVSVDVVGRWTIFVFSTETAWHLWISVVVLAWVVIPVSISAVMAV